MSCGYCYVPFSGRSTGLDFWIRVVDRLSDLGVSSVTFGGGDPIRYKGFRDLLARARSLFEFIQVDTNCYGLRDQDLDILSANSDLVGIPLDGPNAEMHGKMRGDFLHFEVAESGFKRLRSAGAKLKVNTVVAAPNLGSIQLLAEKISELKPSIWSIYEFWPIGQGAISNKAEFLLEPGAFDRAVKIALAEVCGIHVEIGYIASRRGAYFFVGSDGMCYTVSSQSDEEYTLLGSIFDDGTLRRWEILDYQLSNRARITDRRSLLDSSR